MKKKIDIKKIDIKKIDIKKSIREIFKHKKIILPAVAVLLVLIILIVALPFGNDDTIIYKETEAVVGNLMVGVTESGSVDVGTIEQTFDLDISALARDTTQNNSQSSSGATGGMPGEAQGGGMDMFSQIFNFASGGQSTASITQGSDLVIEEVCVKVGQQIQEGDVLYVLSEESVAELCLQLETDAQQASADLEAAYAENEASKLSATHTYDSSIAYGKYALTEFNETIKALQSNIDDKQTQLDELKEEIAQQEAELAELKEELVTAKDMLDRMEYGLKTVDYNKTTYLYVDFEELRSQAQSTYDTLSNEIENLQNNIEKNNEQLVTYQSQLNQAKRNKETGTLAAKQTYDLRMLAYNTADETYDIAMAYVEETAMEQEEINADAQEKLALFNETIIDNAVVSQYSGVVIEVGKTKEDSVNTDDIMVVLYNSDDVTMTVTVAEDDMSQIEKGGKANVSFVAYSDKVFSATITDISDATTDSSGNVIYSVTATLEGDVEDLFQGMTGEVTFITKETKEVLYVSNRAVTRDGGKSYVKLKDESGNIKKKEVVTGFSDGVNVEICEGLSEGDIVLIESKVNG